MSLVSTTTLNLVGLFFATLTLLIKPLPLCVDSSLVILLALYKSITTLLGRFKVKILYLVCLDKSRTSRVSVSLELILIFFKIDSAVDALDAKAIRAKHRNNE